MSTCTSRISLTVMISVVNLHLAHLPHSAASCSDFRCQLAPRASPSTSRASPSVRWRDLREVEGDARGSSWFKSARSLVQRSPLLFPFPFAAPSASEHSAQAGLLGSVHRRRGPVTAFTARAAASWSSHGPGHRQRDSAARSRTRLFRHDSEPFQSRW